MISRLSYVAAALLAAVTFPALAAPASFEPVAVSSPAAMRTGRAGDAATVLGERARTDVAAGFDVARRMERGERRERFERDRRYHPRYDREDRRYRRDRREDRRDRRSEDRERSERR